MAKINYNNADERIEAIMNQYKLERTECGDNYYLMTESEFDNVLQTIINDSVKAFAYQLGRYTRKDTIAWLNYEKGAVVRTYDHSYFACKFV